MELAVLGDPWETETWRCLLENADEHDRCR